MAPPKQLIPRCAGICGGPTGKQHRNGRYPKTCCARDCVLAVLRARQEGQTRMLVDRLEWWRPIDVIPPMQFEDADKVESPRVMRLDRPARYSESGNCSLQSTQSPLADV